LQGHRVEAGIPGNCGPFFLTNSLEIAKLEARLHLCQNNRNIREVHGAVECVQRFQFFYRVALDTGA